MVSPYLMRPVRRLEDVLKIRHRAPGTPEASPDFAHPARGRARAPGHVAARQLRPRVVWVNDRPVKRTRKSGKGSGFDQDA